MTDETKDMLLFQIQQATNTIELLNNKIVHMRDDKEIVKTRVLRRLVADITLLKDAQSALNSNKVNVVRDHIERVIDSLSTELNTLRQEK